MKVETMYWKAEIVIGCIDGVERFFACSRFAVENTGVLGKFSLSLAEDRDDSDGRKVWP